MYREKELLKTSWFKMVTIQNNVHHSALLRQILSQATCAYECSNGRSKRKFEEKCAGR